MTKNDPKWHKNDPIMTKNDPKSPKMTQKDKWPKMNQNGRK